MKTVIPGLSLRISEVLSAAYRNVRPDLAGKVGLYLVELLDPRGFALANGVRSKHGPDPAVLRERARKAGVPEPLLVGSSHVERLAAALESLSWAEPPDRHLMAWSVRELHRAGEVPVVVLLEGIAVISTLDALTHGGAGEPDGPQPRAWSGWIRSVVGKA